VPFDSLLTLALAVLGVHANHPHHAAPMDDLALHANFLDRCSNLHVLLSCLFRFPCTPEDSGLKAPALHSNLNRIFARNPAHL
jgi:hypothetical protein